MTLRPVATPRVVSLRPRDCSADLRAAANFLMRFSADAKRHGFTVLAERLRREAEALDDEAREIDDERAAAERQAVARGCEAVLRWAASDGCPRGAA